MTAVDPTSELRTAVDQVPRAVAVGCATVRVDFVVPAAIGGENAALVGDFAAWSPLAMDRQLDGSFLTSRRLGAGRTWRYHFLIDGHSWINDWDADDYVETENGTCVSVLRT